MKILLSGVQNTGKTTFINTVIDNAYIIKEEVRDIIKQYDLKFNENGNIDSQLFIFFKMYDNFKKLKEEYKNKESIVKDRGLFDAYVYSLYVLNKYPDCLIKKSIIDYMEKLMFEELEYYDNLYLYTIDTLKLKLVDDGFRSLDVKYRKDINDLFISQFNRLFKDNKKCIILKNNEDIDNLTKQICEE